LGGSQAQGALEIVRGAMESGAAGVFFGRNIFQSDDMGGFLRETRAILDGVEAPAMRK
jgi:DhnA family fructose-bisphosphate aldolase class Ia